MKLVLLIFMCSLSYLSQLKAQKIDRKVAASALNFIDGISIPLKSPANKVSAYLQTLKKKTDAANDYKLPSNQTDSLKKYYSVLISEYDNAIKKATLYQTIDKFQDLKRNLLSLLNEGRKPWATVIPVYIKMFTKGRSSLSAAERELLVNSSSIFTNSTEKTREWAKIVAIQLDDIEKKYHLELRDGLYQ